MTRNLARLSNTAQSSTRQSEPDRVAELERQLADLRCQITNLLANDTAGDTIPQFCRKHRISRSGYYDIKRLGKGPREMRPGLLPGQVPGIGTKGTKVIITNEAAADWRREREAETAAAMKAAPSNPNNKD
jgi:hypothetical protein